MNFPAPPPPPEWATNIPSRRGQSFKFHKHLGAAKTAVQSYYTPSRSSGYAEAWIMQWTGKAWETVYYVPDGTRSKELPWRDE